MRLMPGASDQPGEAGDVYFAFLPEDEQAQEFESPAGLDAAVADTPFREQLEATRAALEEERGGQGSP